MDVFGAAAGAAGDFLCDAARAAAHELGVFDVLTEPRTLDELGDALAIGEGRRRLRRLLDLLAALGDLARTRDRFVTVRVPPRPVVPRTGWGQIADVIRTDTPLPAPDWPTLQRMHAHLVAAGAPAAQELAHEVLAGHAALLDLGGGGGAYARAHVAASAEHRATLVDVDEVVGLAREQLAELGDRVRFIAGDIRAVLLGEDHDVALLANVLHLHDASIGAALVEVAAKAVAPGGRVVVKDLRMDEGRTGPLEGLLFALNMALYTPGGDVYEGSQLRAWLAAAGLVDIEERRLDVAPDAIVVIGHKPAEYRIARALDSELSRTGKLAWRELEASGRLRTDARPRRLEYPAPLRRTLARVLADRDDEQVRSHYVERLPRMRVAQIVGTDEPTATIMHAPLDWAALPRMTAALDRLFALLAEADVEPVLPLGAESAAAFRANTPTLAELAMRTHHGGCMPLRHADPADLAYFMSRGLPLHATIDRYLTAPMIHELCHFGRYREALPLQLDACVAGYLGVRVWPELSYPAPGEDDAIYAAPLHAQVGQAIARAFGVAPVVRGHTGHGTWPTVLPRGFVAAAERLAWEDWRACRALDAGSDTRSPRPWVALALVAGAGQSLREHTLESLARVPLATLTLRDDPAFDRAIVEDALRAMCLEHVEVAGSSRVRTRVPEAPIEIDADACCATSVSRGGVDEKPLWYWLPPAVCAALAAHGITGYTLRLADVSAIPGAAAGICGVARTCERDGFSLVMR